MLQALDLDGDGKVSLNDFIRLLVLDQDEEETVENPKNGETEGEVEEQSNKARLSCGEINETPSSADRKTTITNNSIDEDEAATYKHRHKGCALM